jgi:hypothetical protein
MSAARLVDLRETASSVSRWRILRLARRALRPARRGETEAARPSGGPAGDGNCWSTGNDGYAGRDLALAEHVKDVDEESLTHEPKPGVPEPLSELVDRVSGGACPQQLQ